MCVCVCRERGGGVWGKGEGQSVLGVVINYLCRVNPLN